MTEPRTPSRGRLRLVSSAALDSFVRERGPVLAQTALQQTLFPSGLNSLALFVVIDELKDTELIRLLQAVRPKFAIDLRYLPRFDIGALNRKVVFATFASLGIQYRDLSSALRADYPSVLDVPPRQLAEIIGKDLETQSISGPLLFFVPANVPDQPFPHRLIQALTVNSANPWDLCFVPESQANKSSVISKDRTLIFISHANPEDNEFALWLQAKLTSLGFSVWTDLHALHTGDTFWDTIEDVIRNRCAKFIAVLSRNSQQKQGCLDEINLAINVERSQGASNLVLPIRIDDLPFVEIRANLARKNVGDFGRSWSRGVQQLVAVLDRDRVPRDSARGPSELLRTWHLQRSSIASVTTDPEVLTSNWLSIESLPRSVFVYQATPGRQLDRGSALDEPSCLQGNILFSCAGPADHLNEPPQTHGLQLRAEIPLNEFLRGNPSGLHKLQINTAHNILSQFIGQYWERFLSQRGLIRHEFAGRRICYFFPVTTDAVSHVDASGSRRRRALVGRSERRNVYWHFGLEAAVALSRPRHLTLIEHVVFTNDGIAPIESTSQAHRLRRSFCKNWWNDRWRDLMSSALHILSNGEPAVPLIPSTSELQVSLRPMTFTSPLSLRESANDEFVTPDIESPFDDDEEEGAFPDEAESDASGDF